MYRLSSFLSGDENPIDTAKLFFTRWSYFVGRWPQIPVFLQSAGVEGEFNLASAANEKLAAPKAKPESAHEESTDMPSCTECKHSLLLRILARQESCYEASGDAVLLRCLQMTSVFQAELYGIEQMYSICQADLML